jgi:voltage-gated potassium channel Kch
MLTENIPVIYGDMGDPEILDVLSLDKARMVISTSADNHDNKLLLENLRVRRINVPAIIRAETTKEAVSLYKSGADFVIIPEVLAGDELTDILRDHLGDHSYFKDRARIELDKLMRKTLAWA